MACNIRLLVCYKPPKWTITQPCRGRSICYTTQIKVLWLVESSDGWEKVKVLNEMPDNSRDNLRYQGKTWKKLWTYRAKLLAYATGAFNWRVKWVILPKLPTTKPMNKKSVPKRLPKVTWSLAQKCHKSFGRKVV